MALSYVPPRLKIEIKILFFPRNIIDEYAIMYLKFLLNPVPPAMLFTQDRGRSQVISVWMEDTAKVCMNLFLTLLTKNQSMYLFVVVYSLCYF